MEIIFVRHAEKEGLGEDPFLTLLGKKQAEYLSSRLEGEKIDEFYCSDLNRSKETSQILSKKLKIKPQVESSLNEFEAETMKRNKSSWTKEEKKHYFELIKFLNRITKEKTEGKRVLIVAHGVTNRIILSYFLKLGLKRVVPFRQVEVGMNAIYWSEKFKNWRLKYWNDCNHVPTEFFSKSSY